MKKKSILAWHFVRNGWKLRDGTKVEPGLRLKYDGELRMCKSGYHDGKLCMCKSGYHASRKLLDALFYARSPLLCRVRCRGDIIEQQDRLVCSDREVLWCLDAEWYLHEFACRAAEKAIEWSKQKPNPRSVAVINAKRAWLCGEISNKELGLARASAMDSERISAMDSERISAMDSARSSARSSARDAAMASAQYAVSALERFFTRASELDKLNTILTRMIMSAEWEDES